MTNESTEYEIKFYPRGRGGCEWRVWPKSGGPAADSGVARDFAEADKQAKRAKERLDAKRG